MSGVITLGDALAWPTQDKIKLLGKLRAELWREIARPEQLEPEDDWRVWYLMGGRGCLAAGTLVYDPSLDLHIPVEQRTLPGWVQTLDGPRPAGASFAKGRGVIYRVETETANVVEVTDQHQFLTPRGWVHLSEMKIGDEIAVGAPTGLLEGVQRSTGTREDWTSDCSSCRRRYGQPLRSDGATHPSQPLLLGDARPYSGPNGREDGTERGSTHSHLCPRCVHLDRSDSAPVELSLVGEGFPLRSSASEQPPQGHRAHHQSPEWSESRPTDAIALLERRERAGALVENLYSAGRRLLTRPDGAGASSSTLRNAPQAAPESSLVRRDRATLPLVHEAWSRIVSIQEIGVQTFYDLAVPEEEHYLANGIWHHNSGKSRTGAETFCGWINEFPSGEWAIVAPTFADARDTCVESSSSGILTILGPSVQNWNRSLGELLLVDGTKIYLDGADDGALRIQGKNLRGAWCDEIGLWNQWDRAWNESLAFAVRHEPSKIVATGTPKMGHGLVKILVDDAQVPKSRMRTSDNLVNLNPGAVRELYAKYGGTRLGEQELEGEWLEAIEGDMLMRRWWKFFPREYLGSRSRPGFNREMLPKFQMILLSVDTPLKDKETSDYVALQAWGVIGADRYLLDTRVDQMSYEQAKRAIVEMAQTMRKAFKGCQHGTLIENAGYGVELIIDLRRELGSIHKISPGAEGNKTMRALAASSDLETGNCFLPGRQLADLSGPDPEVCPAWVIKFVDEAALFPNGPNDDQVDAWSQAMNWLRTRSPSPMRTASGFKNVVAEAVRNPFLPSLRGGHDGRHRRP